jgi:hypothetical protein
MFAGANAVFLSDRKGEGNADNGDQCSPVESIGGRMGKMGYTTSSGLESADKMEAVSRSTCIFTSDAADRSLPGRTWSYIFRV